MVATDSNRDSATPHYFLRDGQRDTVREARFVEHNEDSGEDSLRVPTLREAQPSKQNGDIRHTTMTPLKIQSTLWLAGNPIPSEAIATSLPTSQPNVDCYTSLGLDENIASMSENIEYSMNEHQGPRSDPEKTLLRRRSSSISLGTTPAVYRGPDGDSLYQRPQISSTISSSVYVKNAEKPLGISDAELRRLLKLRRRVQTIRVQIHAQRAQVDAKRDAQLDADEQYIKRIRTNHVTKEQPGQRDTSELLMLENLWRLCQAARDTYGPALDSLLSLESRLEMEEAKLERTEKRLYEQLDMTLPEPSIISYIPLTKQDDDKSQDEDYESTSPSSQDSRQTDDVGYDDYLRRLGNLDLLQERYQSLINEKAVLEEERAKRFRVGRDLDSENIEFLARFQYIIKPVSIEIEEVSGDVKRLKQLCLEKGLIDADGNPTQDSGVDEESPAGSGEGIQSEHPAENSKPSQYQEPSGNNELDSSVSVYGGSEPVINLWLLHKLRSSSIEVLVFSCYVAACVDNMDGLKWQAEALRLWEQDDAGKKTVENIERLESYIVSSIHRSFDKFSGCEEAKQHLGPRNEHSSKSTVNLTSFPVKFPSRLRAKSAV